MKNNIITQSKSYLPSFGKFWSPKYFTWIRWGNFSSTFSRVFHLALLGSCLFNRIFQRSWFPYLIVLDLIYEIISSIKCSYLVLNPLQKVWLIPLHDLTCKAHEVLYYIHSPPSICMYGGRLSLYELCRTFYSISKGPYFRSWFSYHNPITSPHSTVAILCLTPCMTSLFFVNHA